MTSVAQSSGPSWGRQTLSQAHSVTKGSLYIAQVRCAVEHRRVLIWAICGVPPKGSSNIDSQFEARFSISTNRLLRRFLAK